MGVGASAVRSPPVVAAAAPLNSLIADVGSGTYEPLYAGAPGAAPGAAPSYGATAGNYVR